MGAPLLGYMEGQSFPKAFERRGKNFLIQGNFYEEFTRYAKKAL